MTPAQSQPQITISVIIPLAKGEESWQFLYEQLRLLPLNEIVFCSPDKRPRSLPPEAKTKWITSNGLRADQLNEGAGQATGNVLWFLHADSRLSAQCFELLNQRLEHSPDKLFFFDLGFDADGPSCMWMNSVGANLRSRLFKMPFGDQGFCMSKTNWQRLGRFPSHLPYGEDHAFVWLWRKHGLRIERVPAIITTSARKYQREGYFKTTWKHFCMTWSQALPFIFSGKNGASR